MRSRNKDLFISKIRPARRIRPKRKIFFRMVAAFIGLVFVVLVIGLFLPGKYSITRWGGAMKAPSITVLPFSKGGKYAKNGYSKHILAEMIGLNLFKPDEPGTYVLKDQSGNDLFITTTLDSELQNWVIKTVSKVKAHLAALVVLEPATGNVLALAGYKKGYAKENLTLQSSFPAASIFKIVTAAAVLEAREMTPGSTLTYSGKKHTLYRKYLVPDFRNGQYKTTLEESFAKSINIVFGKLGAFTLGSGPLEDFAERFNFNRPINFDIPVEPSRFDSPGDDTFVLAEKASGFNQETQISPLHGAMIAAAVANEGILMEPSVIKEAFDRDNTIYYRHKPAEAGTVMSKQAASELKEMMKAAISRGTARPAFKDIRYHRTLSRLTLGGKTGTINDDFNRKVDWFVAFAERPGTDEKIALAVLIVHHPDVLGIRARTIGRQTIIRYFNPRTKSPKRVRTARRTTR